MLQTSKVTVESPDVAEHHNFAAEFYGWFVAFVRRQLPIIVISTVATVVLALFYVLNTPPSYTAQATMIIDSHKVNVFKQQSIIGDLPVDSATVESQVEILRSENVALAVIKELHPHRRPRIRPGYARRPHWQSLRLHRPGFGHRRTEIAIRIAASCGRDV